MSDIKNGLYSIRIQMTDGGRGHASGVIVLLDGNIMGGDTHFYYTGSYTFKNGKWRGELTTRQHADAPGHRHLKSPAEILTCQSVAHEDCRAWGYGAEIAARIADELFGRLDAPVGRVAALDTWVGYHPQLEAAILPQTDDLVGTMDQILAF